MKEFIYREDVLAFEDKLKCTCNEDFDAGIACVLDYVATEVPAVDAVEVVHTYWKSVGHKSARICSRCEKDEPYKFADEEADVFDYCPHCGARMDDGD